MKRSNLSKFIGAGVLTLGLAALPSTLPASAQTDTTGGTTTTQTQGTATETSDRDFDWGWLGLLGLAGLAGLAKRNEPVRYQDPNPVGGTTSYRE